MSIKLSICIPTYNRAGWLRFNLPLWAEQAACFPDECEIVVSDNASPDDTAVAVEEAHEFGPIRYSCNEQNIQANPNMHKVVAQVARGEFVWVVGDDDTPTEGIIERVLDVLQHYPELDYIYVNYATWMPLGAPTHRLRANEVPMENEAVNPDVTNRYLPQLKEIVGGDVNCFTPVYASVMRREMSAHAFEGSLHESPFTTLRSVVSHALYIADHCLNRPAFYLGQPGVITSGHSSWPQYLPIYLLHLQPQLFDYFEARGVKRELMDKHRQQVVENSLHLLVTMLTERQTPLRKNFSVIRYLKGNWRFKNLRALILKSIVYAFYLRSPKPVASALSRMRGCFRHNG
jgi:glycosyltransferase involved in cell wall biosynthesis